MPITLNRLFGWIGRIDTLGLFIGLLSLRLITGWDFFESGLEKLHGENWFADIQDRFPWPLSLVPASLSWHLATWFELIGGLALVVGLGTRFFAISLIILSYVAISSVHWPEQWSTWSELVKGYGFSDQGFGNYKYPLVLIGMLLPLCLQGPGRLSLDGWLRARYQSDQAPKAG